MPVSEDGSECTPPRKTTLHCPGCGYESPIDGDWLVSVHAECIDYNCPECETTIESRPHMSKSAWAAEGPRPRCPSD